MESAALLCFQSFGECLRWYSHWHAIVLEGGFDEAGNFIHIPFGNLQQITECLRRRIVGFFLHSKLISKDMAENLLRWRHSGFSVDASIVLPGGSSKKRESLAQYLARPPISLKKVSFESFHGKVLFHTSYNEYFKENLKLFDAADFIALLTQHLPPKGVQYLRRYGLYSSRSRGKWTCKPYVAAHAPEGWKQKHADTPDSHEGQQIHDADPPLCSAERRAAWARSIAKVYEVDSMVCARCGSPMKVLAVINDPQQVKNDPDNQGFFTI